MLQKLSLLGKSTVSVLKKYAPLALALALLLGVAFAPQATAALTGKGASALFAHVLSTPTLDIDFTSALSTIFDYAELIFGVLIGVAAIGIGFRFGLALISWVSDMIGQAFRFR